MGNIEGGPTDLSITHNTANWDAVESIGQGPTIANHGVVNGAPQHVRFTMQDSILTSTAASKAGWYDTVALSTHCPGFTSQEGCSTETFNYDLTTLYARGLAFPGRTPSSNQYIAYYGAPGTSSPNCGATYNGTAAIPTGGCGTGTGNSDIYFPTDSCSGIGFNWNSASTPPCTGPRPLDSGDYHNLAIVSGPLQGTAYVPYLGNHCPLCTTESTNIGINTAALDSAQTAITYVCQSSCNGLTAGPFPDSPFAAPTGLTGTIARGTRNKRGSAVQR
jgi:hypothetical protein